MRFYNRSSILNERTFSISDDDMKDEDALDAEVSCTPGCECPDDLPVLKDGRCIKVEQCRGRCFLKLILALVLRASLWETKTVAIGS